MDQIDVLVAVAHRRLALRRLLVAIERNPELLEEDMTLKIKQPIELVGLKTFMIRAESQERAIAGLGKRYGVVQEKIDECIGASTEHVGSLEHYEGELRRKIEGMVGSNGDPTDGQSGHESGQIISSETSSS